VDDDPPVEDLSQLLRCAHLSPFEATAVCLERARPVRAGLFRRLVTRSPSCLSKLSGTSQDSDKEREIDLDATLPLYPCTARVGRSRALPGGRPYVAGP
jgi:hypothetical protein